MKVPKSLERKFGKVFLVEEETFGGMVVLMHSTVSDFLRMVDSLYKDPPVKQFQVNLGMYMSGIWKGDESTRVHVVWVNSKLSPEPVSAIGPFAHEISHMMDTMMEKSGVKDSAGETRAYLTEKYMDIVLDWLGVSAMNDTVGKLSEALCAEADGKEGEEGGKSK